ncbi:HAD family hydrolase [Sporocytophaga myxococcoides]|uniref:HAD family hydrolase n=1 Tax=Sporocytophaga myxococcoides TaxID=153721 RepID=UPI00068708AE|nr:HAD family hydrolase [Sporocytophaga myxococcoides]
MNDSDFLKLMQQSQPVIKTVFVDIGGVLLSNSWDGKCVKDSINFFGIEAEEVMFRHTEVASLYYCGKISLDEYIKYVVFYTDRNFGCGEYKNFVFEQSKPNDEMIKYIKFLRGHFRLKIVALNNEGRELNEFRIKKFKLQEFVDTFISSSYLKLCKPDPEFYKIALDISGSDASEVLYIEERELMTTIAGKLGIKSILHSNYKITRKEVEKYGFYLPEETLFG